MGDLQGGDVRGGAGARPSRPPPQATATARQGDRQRRDQRQSGTEVSEQGRQRRGGRGAERAGGRHRGCVTDRERPTRPGVRDRNKPKPSAQAQAQAGGAGGVGRATEGRGEMGWQRLTCCRPGGPL